MNVLFLVSVAFVTGPLRPWHGLEVAIRLSSIDWSLPDFQQILKGEWTNIPVVSSCMAIQLTCQSKAAYVSGWNALDQCDSDMNAVEEVQGGSITPFSFRNPHCIALGLFCNIDVHSLCSMIEALNVGGSHQPAMRLTVAVSYALVSFYKGILLGQCDAASLPVSASCSLGTAPYQSVAKVDKNKQSDSPMELEIGSNKPHANHVWPEDTILAISTFAFLFELLSQKPDLADASIAEMRSKLKLDGSAGPGLDCPKTLMSLKFQLGVAGLCLQRLPASSLHHEVCKVLHGMCRWHNLHSNNNYLLK